MDGTDAVDVDGTTGPERNADSTTGISAHHSTPDRVVFTEEGNSDGWIALDADSAIPLRR
ncbi:hypothetical protein [Halobellus sp. GM3]|uniref:hypothetical protein n=1 Tax=Halobellus sp. GM3 TaxID=3458410 RepID=UPI00403D5BF3